MDYFTFRNVTKDDFEVVVGEYNLTLAGDEQGYYQVQEVFIHEGFDKKNYEKDVAILRLEKPVTLSSTVKIATLPAPGMNDFVGNHAVVFGWGVDENNQTLETLKQIEMEFVSNVVCQGFYSHRKIDIKISDQHVCAISKVNISATCHGDSGGKIISFTVNIIINKMLQDIQN